MEKICTKKNVKIFNSILIVLLILIFEFGYCNVDFTTNILTHKGITSFYFSLCRLVMYLAVFVGLYFINMSKIIDEVVASFKNKTKIRITITGLIIEALVFMYYIYKFFIIREIHLIEFSMVSMILISGLIAIENITNKYFTNIISVFIIGMIFSSTVMANHVIDEKRHFMSAYNLSYANIDVNNPIVDKQFMEDFGRGINYKDFKNYFKIKYQFQKGSIPKENAIDHSPTNYNLIIYLPSAVGILIGRILQGSVGDIYLLGRIFNLLAYMGLVLLIIKILPYKKNTFFICMTLPIVLCYSATYSVDGIGVGFIGLFIAYCLKLHENKDNIEFKDLAILSGLFTLVLIYKSMSYAFLGLLVFILPIKEIFKEHYKKIIPLIIVFVLVNILLYVMQPEISLTDNRYPNVNARQQIENVLHNPIIVFSVMKAHVKNTLLNWAWIKDFGQAMFLSSMFENLFFIMFVYYIYAAIQDDNKNFNWKEKTLFVITFGLVYSFISGIFYVACTPVGFIGIAGYQLRYIFPVLPLLMISLSNKNLKNTNKEKMIMRTTAMQVLFIALALIGSVFR